MRLSALPLALAAVACLVPSLAGAQLKRIPAEIVPLVESDGVRAGTTVRAALQVTLPEGFHVQSNAPRDPSLIATELTLEPPAGIRGAEVVFPEAVEFKQEGLPEPLIVFDRHFTVGAQFALAADLAPGSHTVPFTLRYQACDDKVCYAPSTARGEWTLAVRERWRRHAAASRGLLRHPLRYAAARRPGPPPQPPPRPRPAATRPAWRNSIASPSSPPPAATRAPAIS